MKYELMISDIYRVIGLLEGITMLEGKTITEAVTTVLADCVDRLEIVGVQLLAKDVHDDEEPGRETKEPETGTTDQ